MTDQEKQNLPDASPTSSGMGNAENLLDEFGAGQKKAAPTPPPPPAKPAAEERVATEPRRESTVGAEKKPAGNTPRQKADTPKSTPAKKNPSAKSGSGSSKAKVKNESVKEKKPPESVNASTASAHAPKKEKAKPQANVDDTPRSARPAHKVIPYVLMIFAVFVLVSLVLNLFCNMDNRLEDTPEQHLMGVFGYYVCYGLFGIFGPAVFVLPFLLVNLAFFWKRYVDHRVTISKIAVSLLFLILFSATLHIASLITEPAVRDLTAGELIYYGARMAGGGLIGGKLSNLLVVYFNIAGSLVLLICLLAVSLFYFLGMTPQNLWSSYRARRAEKTERVKGKSEQDAEDARNQAAMEEKIRRVTAKQMTIDDEQERGAPKGAVEVTEIGRQKKNPEDKLAPMPLPRLDPNDGSSLFVPRDVNRKMREEAAKKAADAPQKINTDEKKEATQAPVQKPTPASNPAQNRDSAVEPIFPKTADAKQVRRVPKEDRNFDLRNVFIDLDDEKKTVSPPQRKHAPVPPEVPLKMANRTSVASNETRTAQSTQNVQGAQGTRPSQPAAAARPVANAPAKASITGAAPVGAGKAPSLSAVRPSATAKAGGEKPIFRAADNSGKKDFGLSNEEFEKLEAGRVDLSSKTGKTAPKTAASGAASAKKPAATDTKKESPTPAAKPINPKKYVFPPISYLQPGEPMTAENRAEIQASMTQLADTLASFHVKVQEINYSCGPTVTRYEVILAPGVRVRTITGLADDIALALRSSGGVRIEAPIPGTNAVGIEVPNKTRSTIYLRDLIESKEFAQSTSKLSACLGADIAGDPIIFDIAKMPHLLVAGTTGSGKSVCINCVIMSLLYKVRPDEVKLVLIDPKKVEFSIYKNIPHLMAPVVTTPKDAAGALQAAVEEMERRFEVFETVGVRDLKGYNKVTADDPDMPFIPHIVIIIDELADLMMTAKNEVETAICRIAQKARAAGMHLIIGTQRPSADVVTGLIKANVPSSIAFAVKSQVDSRVILDHGGAEALTGRGDMLFVPIGSMRDTRVQGAFVDDKEVEKICEFIRATNGTAQYDEKFIAKLKELAAQCGNKGKSGDDLPPSADGEKGDDPKYADAVRVAIEEKRISTSLLQRKLEGRLLARRKADRPHAIRGDRFSSRWLQAA
ncbi:MAG: DNA translocase FtsK [Clostridia bacterium]|nr:DNA translocase FtsK [Clostridia bacterium]